MNLEATGYLVHSTVRIECEGSNSIKSLGTGFMFGFSRTLKNTFQQ
jgi:hypothetical protein